MKKMIIVAMTKNRVIGLKNNLPWHISEDLKLFKRMTTGNTIIMGKNTYNSIGKPLPHRTNIVISSQMISNKKIHVFKSLTKAIEFADNLQNDIFFIGGAKLYESAIQYADYLSISWIKENFTGDLLFPEINLNEWEIIKETDYRDFIHIIYKKN